MTPPHQDAPAEPIRLLIVDADRRVRSSLTCLIALAEDIEIVRTVGDADSAMSILTSDPVDVILVDPHLPDLEAGLALLEEVRVRWPSISVVAMSGSDDPASLYLRGSAVAFLTTGCQPDALVDAIRSAARSDLPVGATSATLEASAGLA